MQKLSAEGEKSSQKIALPKTSAAESGIFLHIFDTTFVSIKHFIALSSQLPLFSQIK
jgi:hypothetical protein